MVRSHHCFLFANDCSYRSGLSLERNSPPVIPRGDRVFFPDLHRLIDWKQPPEFLDKEFQQIAPASEIGKRHADLLVKVWRKRGKQLVLLLHVEVQAKPEANFAERMFVYALRIFDRFRQPAVSLAIFVTLRQIGDPIAMSLVTQALIYLSSLAS